MFIQTRGLLAACLLYDYVLKNCLLIIWGPSGARGQGPFGARGLGPLELGAWALWSSGPGARAPMTPLLIRQAAYGAWEHPVFPFNNLLLNY